MKKYVMLGVLVLILDLVTKWFFSLNSYTFTNWFSFSYTTNTGAAFSLFRGNNLLLIFVTILILGLCVYYFRGYPLSLTLILAGGLGNLVDRIFFGFVRDFISIGWWPVFNIADASNVLGVFLLAYHIYSEEKTYKRKSPKRK
jgi:signal peptidase II